MIWVQAFTWEVLDYLNKNAFTTSTKADEKTKNYNKQKAGPVKIMNLQPITVTLKKCCTFETISFNRIWITEREGEQKPFAPKEYKIDETDQTGPIATISSFKKYSVQSYKIDRGQVGL